MKTYPASYLAQLSQAVNTLAICWKVVRNDAVEILGTEHTADILISTGSLAGTYTARAGITGSDIRSTSDMSVENMEVTGKLSNQADTSEITVLDLNPADIEAGLLDNAEVTIFMVDYEDPDGYQDIRRTGWLGNISRTAEGRYKTELRSLGQALTQGIVRTYGVACDAELGDARCKVDMTPFTTTGTVFSVTDRRQWVYIGPQLENNGQVIGGLITFTSGENDGFSMEIKDHDETTNSILFYLPMPKDITAGDAFTFSAGCDKKKETCLNVYNNLNNFRGHGLFVPGDNALLKVGKK